MRCGNAGQLTLSSIHFDDLPLTFAVSYTAVESRHNFICSSNATKPGKDALHDGRVVRVEFENEFFFAHCCILSSAGRMPISW